MNRSDKRPFVNQSERYGANVLVCLGDYRELNPDGDFRIIGKQEQIVEFMADGTSEIVAVRMVSPTEAAKALRAIKSDKRSEQSRINGRKSGGRPRKQRPS